MLGPSLAGLAELRCAYEGAQPQASRCWTKRRGSRGPITQTSRGAPLGVENIRGECLVRVGKVAEGRKAIAESSPVIIKSSPAATLFSVEAGRRLKTTAAG
jgi:hypothetical protein